MMTDPISEQRLALVHPDLARRVRAAAAQLEAVGTYFRVGTGLRTYAESDALFQQGRTMPGHIVSNARAGYSQHNHGLAVDCYPFLTGCTGALNYKADTPQFKAMVQALKKQGLVWGGDWKSIVDPPHFQLAGIPVSPTAADRACFVQGGCPAVWAQYRTVIADLHASAHHIPWSSVLWAVAVGCAQRIGHWVMEHGARRLLTRFPEPWHKPLTPEGANTMDKIEQEHELKNQTGTVNDLQAGIGDVFKSIGKGIAGVFKTSPDQTEALKQSLVAFVGKDGIPLVVDAVNYARTALPGQDGVALREAAKQKLKEDAGLAKHDIAAMAGSTLNWLVETGLQYAIAKGLQAVATVALHAGADEDAPAA